MPSTVRTAICVAGVQLLWAVIAGIAALGSYVSLETVAAPDGTSYRAIYCNVDPPFDRDIFMASRPAGCVCNGQKISDGECEYRGVGMPLMIFWLLSLAWGCAVFQNVVACMVTGSVASWWFSPEDRSPVKGAFYRATHTSFG